MFTDNSKILFFSQGKDEAEDLISKARYIHSQLPKYLQLSENGHMGRIYFPFTHSVIEAKPSTDKAGKGTDTTIVVRDELFTHEKAAENFTSIMPTLDSGGQSIDLSTLEDDDLTNHFRMRVDKAYKGSTRVDYPSGLVLFKKGRFDPVLVFLGWQLRPVRLEGLTLDEFWNEKLVPKYTPSQLEKQYPATIEELLRVTESTSFFDIKALDAMRYHIQEPLLEGHDVPLFDGMVQVYKPPVIGESYFGFTDPSDGVDDPMHSVFMHSKTYEGVCEVSGKVKADKGALIHDTLVRCYNEAYNTFEANSYAGAKFGETIKNLKTPNQASRRDIVTGKIIPDKEGWYTTGQFKDMVLNGLEEAIRTKQFITHSRETIEQFKSIIKPEGEKPRTASKRGHDDAVMAWANVLQLKKYLPNKTPEFHSFKY